jgi:hypothetical protein
LLHQRRRHRAAGVLGSNETRQAARGTAGLADAAGRCHARASARIQRVGRSRLGGAAARAGREWSAHADRGQLHRRNGPPPRADHRRPGRPTAGSRVAWSRAARALAKSDPLRRELLRNLRSSSSRMLLCTSPSLG